MKWHILWLATNVLFVAVISILVALKTNSIEQNSPSQEIPGQTQTPHGEENSPMVTLLKKMFNEALENSTSTPERISSATASEISMLKPLVHLTGIDMDLQSPDLDDTEWTEVTGWLKGGEENLVRNGFKVKGGRLIIPTSGSYRIYVQLKFAASGTVHNQSLPFELNLYRMDAVSHTEDRLLGNGKSYLLEDGGVIGPTPHIRMYGMYAQTVEQFNALDEIYVKVKYITALLSDKEWSYMGAYIVDTA